MRARTVGGLCSVALFVACFIDKHSDSLTCTTNDDCADLDGNRICTGGYCVESNCPDECTTCDEFMRTCTVECTTDEQCSAPITCPSGWNCTINCTGEGACDDVFCRDGSRCTVNCNGTNACNDVECSDACRCDLTCVSGACDSMSCPTRGNGANQVHCTQDGSTSSPCDSSHAASCASC